MRTVICHFFDEAYLLPWWLKHHLPLFDHGVLIDHGSTDGSADLCRELAPHWQLVRSRLMRFDAYLTDFEVMNFEYGLPGWKLALNVTEFLMTSAPLEAIERHLEQAGRQGCAASGMLIVDESPQALPDPASPLPAQKHFGIDDNAVADPAARAALGLPPQPQRNRFYHRLPVGMYMPGRHQSFHPDSQLRLANLMIFHFGYAPWNDRALARKLQIAKKLVPGDVERGWGAAHTRGVEALQADYLKIRAGATDLLHHEHAGVAIRSATG